MMTKQNITDIVHGRLKNGHGPDDRNKIDKTASKFTNKQEVTFDPR